MGSSLVEWVAVALALSYVLLATRQSLWCWPAAGASGAIYLLLFARAGLTMQAALQGFYVAMSVYGWISWRASHGQPGELSVSAWPLGRHLAAAAFVIVATVANVYLLAGDENPLVRYADSFVAWGSVIATWMMTRKVVENWLYWMVFDLVAAALYFSQGFHATAGLFLVYIVLAVRGYLQWRKCLVKPGRGVGVEPVTDAR
ncbi:MAG: nicotinamide riboside transporter PnuC [Steroidobacteraceae bacterium]|nr:nicotinamide riboside transporter PnuC [Steroidobacteraceae bacterium]